jgi:SepF-like predicted cell division protein (DUF552 family)
MAGYNKSKSGRTKNINLHFMVDEKEKVLIEQKMELSGIGNMRAYLLKMAVDGYVVQLDLAPIRDMVTLLRNATNNLNQIAKRVNSGGGLYQADIDDLREHYDRLWEKAEGIMRQLARL